MKKDLDIIIYGATGFTGQLCVKYLQSLNTKVKWAIAGRNKESLKKVSKDCYAEVEIFIADSHDTQALDVLTLRSKVILSTAGPFHLYGSKLVASCIKNNTHYVDITGENFWVKSLINKHHKEASSKGIKIIPSCGFDSIPSDLGVFYVSQILKKPIKRIEAFYSLKGRASGGTIETMFSTKKLKTGINLADTFLLNPDKSYSNKQKYLSNDFFKISKINDINAWSAPFIMSAINTRVVRRSDALLKLREEPYGSNFTYQEYTFYKNWFSALKSLIIIGILALVLMSPIKRLVRPFLLKPGEGPSENFQKHGWFVCKYIAETEDGEKSLFKMQGKGDPGYKITSKLVVESALCLIEDIDNLPGGSKYGGVLTSASALGDSLIARFDKVGISFHGPLKNNETKN